MELLSLSALSGAFLLLAQAASNSGRRRRAYVLGFAALLIFALTSHTVAAAWAATPVLGATVTLLRNLGVALVAGAVLLALRRSKPKAFLVPGVLALLLAGLLHTAGVLAGAAWKAVERRLARPVPGQLLVELGPDDTIGELAPILQKFNARHERAFPRVSLRDDEDLAQYFIVYADEALIPELAAALGMDRENVDSISRNDIVELEPAEAVATRAQGRSEVNDPRVTEQWGFQKSEGELLVNLLNGLKPARKAIVAIVDTGVDAGHEDIAKVFGESSGKTDGHGHGSHCAGIAGAATNNKIGIASYNWEGQFIEIRGYKALSDSGSGSAESVAQAIIDAAQEGADVISMSLGGYAPTPPKIEVDAIEFALKKGCIVVCAAGNSDEDAKLHAPANIPGVITVAALDQDLRKASFSNTNTSLEMPIAAPGVAILSLKSGGGYVAMSGTSMATPMVAGLVGIMRALNPTLTPAATFKILHDTGLKVSDAAQVGHGINAATAIQATLNGKR